MSELTESVHFNPEARSPQAAEISTPLDFRIDAEIPEITRLCLKYIILSGEDDRFIILPERMIWKQVNPYS